jgi:hypothetical protein
MDPSVNIDVNQILAEYGLSGVEDATPTSQQSNENEASNTSANSSSNLNDNNGETEEDEDNIEDVEYEDVSEETSNTTTDTTIDTTTSNSSTTPHINHPEDLVNQTPSRPYTHVTSAQVDELLETLQGNIDVNRDAVPAKQKPNIIEENTEIINENLARFSSAEWFEEIQKQSITLAGLGGIGSWVALILSRLNPQSIYMFDDDKVEEVNMAGQFYSSYDVRKYKVDAVCNSIIEYSKYYNAHANRVKYDYSSLTTNIMICGFDNMSARKVFFGRWKNHIEEPKVKRSECLFIDGRLTADELQVFAIKGDDTYNINRYYSEYLFDDSQAEETVCSFKQTTYCATMIASIIENIFTNFIASLKSPLLYDVPFKTYYGTNLMFFKTES